jgi:hypothetical protein
VSWRRPVGSPCGHTSPGRLLPLPAVAGNYKAHAIRPELAIRRIRYRKTSHRRPGIRHLSSALQAASETLDNNKEGCISAIRGSLWLVQGEESSHNLHSFYILPAHSCRELLT